MVDLPATPVPADADLRHFPNMPLGVNQLRRSKAWLICKRRPELGFYMVNLWGAAWLEVPAGSLEDDDDVLADAAMCSPERWGKVRDHVMRGWIKFSDGRLYHRVVCEKVIEALNSTKLHRFNKAHARLRKDNVQRKKNKLDPLPYPERPSELALNWPTGGERSADAHGNVPGNVTRTVTERGFSSEGKGKDSLPRGALPAPPLGTVPETSPPIAARGSLEGSTHDGVHARIVDIAKARVVQ